MANNQYEVPNGTHSAEIEVKKSRFIAWAFHAESRDKAMQYLAECKTQYPDARHHCWAYLIGDPRQPITAAMSDDGEPSGTAGKPILNVLQHKNVGDIMLVVVRYFGGIKLGAGGLVRAYSGAAQNVMSELPTKTHVALTEYLVEGNFDLEQSLRHWLESNSGTVVDVEYSSSVVLRVALPSENKNALRDYLINTSGRLLEN